MDEDVRAPKKHLILAYGARRSVHLSDKDGVDRLAAKGTVESKPNLRDKIIRGGFSAGVFVQCLVAIGVHSVRLHDAD